MHVVMEICGIKKSEINGLDPDVSYSVIESIES